MDDDERDFVMLVYCRNKACPDRKRPQPDVHPTGLCNSCCAKFGSLNCTTCWPEEEDR